MNRRSFIRLVGMAGSGAALAGGRLSGAVFESDQPATGARKFGSDSSEIPDTGWRLWPDTQAAWRDDAIFLPGEAQLADLPAHPPTGGWDRLDETLGRPVSLPATVEQFYWGLTGFRPFHDEYKFEATDDEVRNGAYYGVSWWWRPIAIPPSWIGRRILLHIRAARQRAEVYLNGRLVGYSVLEELPFVCDLTAAARAGANELAIRITNPGGRLDWVDGSRLDWGGRSFQKSHGFGGLDRGLVLSAHGPVRIADAWALNTPEARTIAAHAEVENTSSESLRGVVIFNVIDPATGQKLTSTYAPLSLAPGATGAAAVRLTAGGAELWDLDHPRLYRLRASWRRENAKAAEDLSEVDFGFRWFAAEGVGSDALFRLNGRRIRLYTSISWGFWALNGLFPSPELAAAEVRAAKAFNLNALNFHRNLAKEEVLALQDRAGLLRCLEPGGGSQAVAPAGRAGGFSERYMRAKIVGMIRAFRSHPSVVHYIIQNEGKPDTGNPALVRLFETMRAEDPSRSIVGTDGFVMRNPQAWEAAYGDRVLESAKPATSDGGAAGWWVDHSGHATDVWQDACYRSPRDYYYRSTDRTEIVEWGEMKGPASSDDHGAVLAQIAAHGGESYDRLDHRQILEAYDAFLDRWGFRAAFPTASRLFRSIGQRAYDSWGQLMENVRISDETDMAAISGWESTAIENHSGLVDNFRGFKADPRAIAESLQPLRPVAKQRQLVLEPGQSARFDLYLLNDTGQPAQGELVFTLTSPSGRKAVERAFPVPAHERDRLSYLVAEGVASEPLDEPGIWVSRFALSGHPRSDHRRELLLVAPAPAGGRPIAAAWADLPPALVADLQGLPGVSLRTFEPGGRCDVIVTGGGRSGPAPRQAVDADGADLARAPSGEAGLSEAVLDAVRAGTPLLALGAGEAQAAALARRLADAGAFRFDGLVGTSRASWMGAWYFVRRHPLYEGMPVDQALGLHYQVRSSGANGWRIDGEGVEIVAGFGRDHDRHLGAGTAVARVGGTPVVLHQIAGMHPALNRRFLGNALRFLGPAQPAKI